MQCPRCQHENRQQAKFCEECGTPLTANPGGRPASSYAEITSALTEAREQKTATSEILRVISSSPADLAPVMDAVTRNAARLARADHALIGEAAEGRIRWLAASGCPLLSKSVPISRQVPSGRAILDCQTTQVEDVAMLIDFPGAQRAYDELGVRTILATPLVREGRAIGVLLVRRTRVQPFSGKEIELLRTFADQAVIAIENVRLFQELQVRNRDLTNALERETATGSILRAIATSPTDPGLVFESILESALRLCGATIGSVHLSDGRLLSIAAIRGPAALLDAVKAQFPRRLTDPGLATRAAREGVTVHVPDVREDPASLHEID
jgi:two-component system NtrC family sensor kinase